MANEHSIHGILGEFSTPEALSQAAEGARLRGWKQIDAFTPFPVEGMAEALGMQYTWVPFFVLGGGIAGGALAYGVQYFAMAIDYPFRVGGRPLNSWPSFIPITFELTILFAAISALIMVLFLSGLPKPYHPLFNSDRFSRASQDRFFLYIEASDKRFDAVAVKGFLTEQGAESVEEIAP